MIHAPRLLGALVVFTALAAGPAPARAQDLAAAEALFREGKALLDAGNYAGACAKLAESQRLDPSSGTLINLASCHERQGKTATAWAEYLAAARLAKAQGKPERAQEATGRAAVLETRLSYVTVQVASPVPGLEIYRDDVRLEASAVGSKIPIDPGPHRVRVEAPGYETTSLDVTIGEAGDAQTIAVPALRLAPAPAEPADTTPSGTKHVGVFETGPTRPTGGDQGPGRTDRTLAWVVGGAGAVALGTGAVLGLLASGAYGDAEKECPTHRDCNGAAMSKRDDAETLANLSNVGFGLGVIGVGVGTVLWVTSSPSDVKQGATTRPRIGLVPRLGVREGGLTVRGTL